MWTAIYFSYAGDTVRRRLMTFPVKYKGFTSCAKMIFKKEGIKGFYLGASIITFQSITGCTLMYIYDRMFSDLRKNTLFTEII